MIMWTKLDYSYMNNMMITSWIFMFGLLLQLLPCPVQSQLMSFAVEEGASTTDISVRTVPSDFSTSTGNPFTIWDPSSSSSISNEEELDQLLDTCPASRDALSELCHSVSHSCKTRCGGRSFRYQCHCDNVCLASNDCCWDFEEECPTIAGRFREEFESTFDDVRTKCIYSTNIIESCGIKEHEKRDIRLPLIRIKSGTIIFRNQNVYAGCLGEEGKTKYITDNSRHVIFVQKGASLEGLQQLFLNGTVDKDSGIFVKHESTKLDRGCPGGVVKILCQNYPTNHPCHAASNEGFYAAGSASACRQLADSNNVSVAANNWPHYFDFNTTQTRQHADDEANFPTCSAYFRGLTNMTWPAEHTERYMQLDELYLVIAADFGNEVSRPELKEHRLYRSLNSRLNKYKCEQADTKRPSCTISAVCDAGYIPVRLICRKATDLVIQVVGVDTTNTLLKLENVLYVIFVSLYDGEFQQLLQPFSDELFDDFTDVIYDTSRQYKAVSNFMTFKRGARLDYGGEAAQLPLTNVVIQRIHALVDTSEIGLDDIIRKVILCVTLTEEAYHGRLLLCDRLLPLQGSLILDSHFTLAGLELPDPFQDILEPRPSSGGHDNLPRLGLVMAVMAALLISFVSSVC